MARNASYPANKVYNVHVEGSVSPCGTKVLSKNQKKYNHTFWQYEVNYMGYIVSETFLVGSVLKVGVSFEDSISEQHFKENIVAGVTRINTEKPKSKVRMDFSLPLPLIEFIKEEASREGKSKSEIVAEAIKELKTKRLME